MKFGKVAIIGMGLIGGSIGKALIELGLAEEVIGVCRRQSSLDRAVSEKSLTKGFVNSYDEALADADIVIIATPVHTIKEVLEALSGCLEKDVLVTDVGSTKKEIAECAGRYKDNFVFIGSHPLAGSERKGVEFSAADLFKGSVCVITPGDGTDEDHKKKLKGFWEALGAAVMETTPERHDEVLAFSSHLPHVVAFALAGILDGDFPKEMFSTGFKDTTRIASSDAVLWSDIFFSNRDNVLKSITRYKEVLSGIEEDIRAGDREGLKEKLEKFKRLRDEII
jgi:prephenate dehydrogenase